MGMGVEYSTKRHVLLWFTVILAALCAVFIVFVIFRSVEPKKIATDTAVLVSSDPPTYTVELIVDGLDHPWDVAFLPGGQLIFTERNGKISALENGVASQIAVINDVKASGEGGLMGLAVDPDFAANHFIYTCYTTSSDVRVVRWKISEDGDELTDKKPIVTGIFSGSGNRHQGCRIAFGPDGYLWIGTGDAASAGQNPQTPQNPKSLAGKILRVDREGKAVPGNLGAPFDDRIYSYGHRNVQGIAFLPSPYGDVPGYSTEHGSTIDDEINVLKKGNFGWDPDVAYTERGVPMTDIHKFPDAIEATWRSGSPTHAPSGLAILSGEKWKGWNGALAVAMLKDQCLEVILLDKAGKVTKDLRILTEYGRLRDAELAPDSSLYISTDNGNNKDKIFRVVPN